LIKDVFASGFNNLIREGGRQFAVKYYLSTTGSIYDEAITLTQSGNTVWTSGILQCPDPNNAEDNLLLEQGKIAMNDLRIYLHGSLWLSQPTTGSVLQTKVGSGSPVESWFSLIPIGAQSEDVSNQAIYKRAFIRRLTNGSLIGE